MGVPVRLGLFAAALVAAFVLAFVVGSSVGVPAPAADSAGPDVADEHGSAGADHAGDGDQESEGDQAGDGVDAVPAGLQVSSAGYTLADVSAPQAPGESGELTFRILGADGRAVTDFQVQHEQQLHLIVVSADGVWFEHAHPELSDDGTWSLPWEWPAAGAYRIYADFLPLGAADGLTLTTSTQVVGEVVDRPLPPPSTSTTTGPYEVHLTGALSTAGGELTFAVSRDGRPVQVEPYLGAAGHLVALRMGDLAYLHVHPEADSAEPSFHATAPSAGTYRLFLDFQVAGQVHTADFTVTIED